MPLEIAAEDFSHCKNKIPRYDPRKCPIPPLRREKNDVCATLLRKGISGLSATIMQKRKGLVAQRETTHLCSHGPLVLLVVVNEPPET